MTRDAFAPTLARLEDADSFRSFGLKFLREGDFGPAILMFREAAAMTVVGLGHSLGEHVGAQTLIGAMARGLRWFPGGAPHGDLLRAMVTLDGVCTQVRTPGVNDGRGMGQRVTREDAEAAEIALHKIHATLRTHITATIRRDQIDAEQERSEMIAHADDDLTPN